MYLKKQQLHIETQARQKKAIIEDKFQTDE